MENQPTQRLAWSGFSLTVPESWNLRLRHGNAKAGAIVLADLHEAQLEIRWQTLRPRAVGPRCAKLLARLKKRGAKISSLAPLNATRADHPKPKSTLTFIPTGTRLYELTWPGRHDLLPQILASFEDHASDAVWPWELFGTSAMIPANYRLKQTILQPGRTQFTFRRYGQKILCGSWSMADRLLAQTPLQTWAGQHIPLVRNNPRGAWQTTADSHIFTVPVRTTLLRRRRTLTLMLNHDPVQNVIRWTQTTGR